MTTASERIRLLLVDDEVDFLEAMTPALTRRGFRVRAAADGPAALQVLWTEPVDVVVLDVKMPGMNGVEVFHEIRRVAPGLPVILLTGHGSIPQAFETSRDGVADYLTKPCDADHLAEVVRRVLVARSAGDEHPAPIADHIRLLLVDDDRDFTAALRPALERRGLDVTVAQSGTDAAGLPGRQGFDVAIVDLRMPDMDGLTLLAALKDADPALEVIVLTAHGTAESARRGLVDGAFDYLTKPQPVDVLVRRVLAAFRRRREREDDDRGGDVDRILSRYPD